MGFTTAEVEQLIEETITEEPPLGLMDTLTEYYNGYCFSEDGKIRVFNSDMVLYYLDHYQQLHKAPRTLLDHNVVSDYGKLEGLIKFRAPEQNREILKEIISDGYTTAKLTERYYLNQEFGEDNFKSLLFYLGLLTIKEANRGRVNLQIPNTVMMELYSAFLRKIIARETSYDPRDAEISQAIDQLAYENSCEKFITLIEGLLKAISNQDYRKFDEKYIKLAMFSYAWVNNLYFIKSEYEVEGTYIDLVFLPQNEKLGLDTLLFELKYIKKEEASKEAIAAALAEAVTQLRGYGSVVEFANKKVTAWAIVFSKDECVARENVDIV